MLKIDCLENKAIRDIKSEVLQFRKSTDKRTSMQLLSEFIGNRKLRLVGIGVTRLRERDEKQTLITDF